MADLREKASMQQIMVDIKPYVITHFAAKPAVQEQDIPVICRMLLSKYKNVMLLQGLSDNKPYFKIQVKKVFGTDEKVFDVVTSNKQKSVVKKKDNHNWIDKLEEIDALYID